MWRLWWSSNVTKIIKTIEFSNVRLLISIGIHEHERAAPQPLAVSLSIRVQENDEGDNIDNTLDYDTVYHFLKSLEQVAHFDLQETVCRRILTFVLGLEGVEHVKVSTGKTDIYPETDFVGLTMEAGNGAFTRPV